MRREMRHLTRHNWEILLLRESMLVNSMIPTLSWQRQGDLLVSGPNLVYTESSISQGSRVQTPLSEINKLNEWMNENIKNGSVDEKADYRLKDIFADHMPCVWHVSTTHKERWWNSTANSNPVIKQVRDVSRYFSREWMQRADRHTHNASQPDKSM